MTRLVPGILAVVPLMISAATAQPRQDLVSAELVADVSAVKPGDTFNVGVLLKVEPGWHVYWLNPGDSGRETTVTFQAPAGFKVGKLRFPVPVKFDQPGNAIGYGYEREVLLAARVKAPADVNGALEVTIAAEPSWLCCADACIPGKAKLSITLPVSEQPLPANERLFAKWAGQFPQTKHPDVEFGEWQTDHDAGTFTTRILWKAKPPAKAEWYPGKDESIEVDGVTVHTSGKETSVSVKARVLPGQTPKSDRFFGLLIYTDEKGIRRGISLSVPVGKAATSAGP